MTLEETTETLAQAIRDIRDVVNHLDAAFGTKKRHFTLDGHLLGSMAEVYADARYNLRLYESSAKAHDAEERAGKKRRVQIKATQRESIGLSKKPEYLIVFQVSEDGYFTEVYNGPGGPVWEPFEGRTSPSNGQFRIPLSRLKKLNREV